MSIVGTDEVNLDRGRISWASPPRRALMKAAKGDEVVLHAPGGTGDPDGERIPVETFRVPDGF